MRIKSIHIALVAAITFLVAPASASAIGIQAPSCPDGRLFRTVGRIVCIKVVPTRVRKSVIPRRVERKRFNIDQRRNYVKKRIIHKPNRPFALRVTDKRTSRARRAAAFSNYRKKTNYDFIKKNREEQRIHHESRRRR